MSRVFVSCVAAAVLLVPLRAAQASDADFFADQFMKGFMHGFSERRRENEATNRTMSQLATLQQVIRRNYSQAPSYEGLTDDLIIDELPADMRREGRLVNAFGGGIRSFGTDWGGRQNAFAVAFTKIPWDACIKLVTVELGTGHALLLTETFDKPGFLTKSEALQACANPLNSIMWVFY